MLIVFQLACWKVQHMYISMGALYWYKIEQKATRNVVICFPPNRMDVRRNWTVHCCCDKNKNKSYSLSQCL